MGVDLEHGHLNGDNSNTVRSNTVQPSAPTLQNIPIAVQTQSPRWWNIGEILSARPTSPSIGGQDFSGQNVVHAQSLHSLQQAKY